MDLLVEPDLHTYRQARALVGSGLEAGSTTRRAARSRRRTTTRRSTRTSSGARSRPRRGARRDVGLDERGGASATTRGDGARRVTLSRGGAASFERGVQPGSAAATCACAGGGTALRFEGASRTLAAV